MVIDVLEQQGIRFKLDGEKLQVANCLNDKRGIIKEFREEIKLEMLKREALESFNRGNDLTIPVSEREIALQKFMKQMQMIADMENSKG